MRTSTEIFNETNRWTLKLANEYLQAFMKENSIDTNWKIENIASYGKKPWYCINMKQPGVKAVRIDCYKDTLKSLITSLHIHKDEYIALMNCA